jgi:hypothetical protein
VRSLREERAADKAPAKADPIRPAQRSAVEKTRKPGLSQKEQRQLAEIEARLALLHGQTMDLDAILAVPSAFLRPDSSGHQALRDREAIQAELEGLELDWLTLEDKRSGA